MSKSKRKQSAILSSLLVATLLTAGGKPALAQSPADTYPSRVVTLINPFVAGSTTDSDARPMLQYLTATFGKSFILDYKPGAGGITGNNYVAKAKPDGHTLLIVTTSFATNFQLRENMPYSYKEFAPISLLSRRPVILVVTPSLPVNNFAEYLAYAKANPEKLNWGTSGVGSIFHMAGAYLAAATGTKVTFIHYKGNAQGFLDLFAGRTQVSPMTTFAALPYIKSGKVRPIAHLTASRSRALPNLPSVAELGVAGYDYSGWGAILATGGTPAPIVNKLAAAIAAYTRSPDASARAIHEGYELESSTPEALGKFIESEIARWGKVARENNIKAGDE